MSQQPVRWIVVGTDFSAGADQALLRASALASALGAAVACTHAYEDPPGTSPECDLTEAVKGRMEEVASRMKARFPTLAVECFVRRGAPWDKLANVACELGADLIVVGAYGHGRARPPFVGSVVTRILATSSRSVLVVPDQDASVLRPSL